MKNYLRIGAIFILSAFAQISFAQETLEEDEGVKIDPVKFYINKTITENGGTCNCQTLKDQEIVYTFDLKESFFNYDKITIHVHGEVNIVGMITKRVTPTQVFDHNLAYPKDGFSELYSGKKDVKRTLKDAANTGKDKYGEKYGWTSFKYEDLCKVKVLTKKMDTLSVTIEVYGSNIASYDEKYDEYSKKWTKIPVYSAPVSLAEGKKKFLQYFEPKK